MKNLVIVESPTKAKTIAKFLGPDFDVKSSFGHIRDLPKDRLGVEVEKDFAPQYVIPADKRQIATALKKLAAKTKTIYFATDGDREGEAISWHLAHIFNLEPEGVRRLIFHEITKEAIEKALAHPRPLDLNLVNAQQTRRILDRLVGYKLSPFLWSKVARGLSAGRVQSVAVRLVVEREREIQNFKKEEHWTIEADFAKKEKDSKEVSFRAKLHKINDKILSKMAVKSETEAKKIIQEIPLKNYSVFSLEKKPLKRLPPPPFITSTLQQEAYRLLGFSAKQTMMLAQRLYEGVELLEEGPVGLITYMRTDSVNLAEKFLTESRQLIASNFGQNYLSPLPRRFKTKSKLAQEAHEAIRPTEINRAPESLKDKLEPRLWKLYQLIWKRALATQMAEAKIEQINANIASSDNKNLVFQATGSHLIFEGFLKLYPQKQKENQLPPLQEKDRLDLLKIEPGQHFTEPPARYNDASLIKTLEEYGIGRPSTYAPTISTILARRYVERGEKKQFTPTEIGFLVTDLLTKHFPQIVDYKFTAQIEDDLDEIAKGKKEWAPTIREFYQPFEENLQKKYQELHKKDLTEEASNETCEKCGHPLVIKMGRFGRFLACKNFPACKNTRPWGNNNGQKAKTELLEEKCPQCNAPLARRHGRFGEFISCSAFPKCKFIKKELRSLGLACPSCRQGEILERRTRRRKIFYSCSRYPECKFALWQRPTGEKCPACGSLLVEAGKDKIQCSNKECPSLKDNKI